MVIFGAGASYDSCPTYPAGLPGPGNRPPLAKDLFDNRQLFVDALDYFPQCKPVVPRLRDPNVLDGHYSIEMLLQEIEEESATYPRGKQELLAIRCYLQRAISECQREWQIVTRGVTNHLSLLREIERLRKNDEQVLLVTFNYDTILDEALKERGFRIDRMGDYKIGHPFFKLFKLHGSINWGLELESQIPANVNLSDPPSVLRSIIENADRLVLSDRYVLCPPRSMGVLDNCPVFPAIAIPVQQKSKFVCPELVLKELVSMLPRVTKIITIGWRATEDHFLRLLKAGLQPGLYISVVAGNQKEAEDVRVNVNSALFPNEPVSVAEVAGFTTFIRSRRVEEVLAR